MVWSADKQSSEEKSSGATAVYTSQMINLTNYTKLRYTASGNASRGSILLMKRVTNGPNQISHYWAQELAEEQYFLRLTGTSRTIDISDIEGSYYIAFQTWSSYYQTTNFYLHNVILEK